MVSSLANYTIFQVNDLINYSQNFDIEISNKHYTDVYLKDILTFCYDILEALIFNKVGLSDTIKPVLYLSKTAESMIIKTDEIKLKQLLLNLITNSVKFTKNGKITLSADFESGSDEGVGKHLVIRVIDTGIGIDDTEKAQINKKINEKFSNQLDDNDYMASKIS